MHVSRLLIVSLLILMMVFTAAYSPVTGEELNQIWEEEARPAVLVLMDNMYALIRNFVAGSDAEDGIDDNAPGLDFDLITTMDHKNPS